MSHIRNGFQDQDGTVVAAILVAFSEISMVGKITKGFQDRDALCTKPLLTTFKIIASC